MPDIVVKACEEWVGIGIVDIIVESSKGEFTQMLVDLLGEERMGQFKLFGAKRRDASLCDTIPRVIEKASLKISLIEESLRPAKISFLRSKVC